MKRRSNISRHCEKEQSDDEAIQNHLTIQELSGLLQPLRDFAMTLVIFVIAILFALPAKSCACGTEVLGGYGIGGPIITMPGYTLPQGKLAIGTGLQYNNAHEFSASKLASLNARNIHSHSQKSSMTYFANLAYGLTDDLDLILSYPYQMIYGLQSTFSGTTIDEGDAIGFGDMTLLAKYRISRCASHFSLLAGMKFPTGQTNEKNEFGFELAADDQPGTGSWDPVLGVAISKPYKAWSFDTNALYRLSTKGNQDVIVGDIVSYNFAATYNMQQRGDFKPALVLEMNGIWQEKVEFNGLKDNNHGGNVIYLSPGLRLGYKNLVWSLSAGLPVINDLNGFQPDAGIQLFSSLNLLI